MAPSKRKPKPKKKTDGPRQGGEGSWLPVINGDNHDLFQSMKTVPQTWTFLYQESSTSSLAPQVVQLDTSSQDRQLWAKPLFDTKLQQVPADVNSKKLYTIAKLHLDTRDACALTLMTSTELWGPDHFSPDWLDVAFEAQATTEELLAVFVNLKHNFLDQFMAGNIEKALEIARSLAEYWNENTGEKEEDPMNYFEKHEITGEKVIPVDKVPHVLPMNRDYWVIIDNRIEKDEEVPIDDDSLSAVGKQSKAKQQKARNQDQNDSDNADLACSTVSGDLESNSELSDTDTPRHNSTMSMGMVGPHALGASSDDLAVIQHLGASEQLRLPPGSEENPINPYIAPPPDPESIKFMIQVPVLDTDENKKIVRRLISMGVDGPSNLAKENETPREASLEQDPALNGKKKKNKNKNKNKKKRKNKSAKAEEAVSHIALKADDAASPMPSPNSPKTTIDDLIAKLEEDLATFQDTDRELKYTHLALLKDELQTAEDSGDTSKADYIKEKLVEISSKLSTNAKTAGVDLSDILEAKHAAEKMYKATSVGKQLDSSEMSKKSKVSANTGSEPQGPTGDDSLTKDLGWVLWEPAPNPKALAPSPGRFPIYATGDLKAIGVKEVYAIIPVKGLTAYRNVNRAICDFLGEAASERAYTVYTSKRFWRVDFSSGEKYGSKSFANPDENTGPEQQPKADDEYPRIALPLGSRFIIIVPSKEHDLADFRALEHRMGSCEAAIKFSIEHDLDMAYVIEPTESTFLSLATEQDYYMIYPSGIEDAKLSDFDLECIRRGKTVAISNNGHTAPTSTHQLAAIYKPSDESRAAVRLVNKILDAAIRKGDRAFVAEWTGTVRSLHKIEESRSGKLNRSFARQMVRRLLEKLDIMDIPVVSVEDIVAYKRAADMRAEKLFQLFGKPEPAYLFMTLVQECVEDSQFKAIDFERVFMDKEGNAVRNESNVIDGTAQIGAGDGGGPSNGENGLETAGVEQAVGGGDEAHAIAADEGFFDGAEEALTTGIEE